MSSPERVHVLYLMVGLYVGGAETHTISLINGLASRGIRSSVIYLKKDEALLPRFRGSAADRVLFIGDVMGHASGFGAFSSLDKFCEEEGVDIVVAVDPYPILFAAFLLFRRALLRRPKIKLVEILHMTDLNSLYYELKFKLIYSPLLKLFDSLVFVSENQARHWLARGLKSGASEVITNGIDPDFFSRSSFEPRLMDLRSSLGIHEDTFVISICASLRPEKAHADLINAVVRLRDNGVNFRLLVVGDGVMRSSLEGLVNRLSLDECVVFVGSVSDVRPYLAISDLMALVSHSVETFSIAVLEAMSMGVPVVASNIGGASEQIEDGVNGYLFDAGDVTQLANILLTSATRGAGLEMGAVARNLVVQRFSSEVMYEKYARLYFRLR
jgi:glycosyltransferase involved in cell wall biosynthesis